MLLLRIAVEGWLRDVGAWWRREWRTVLLLFCLQFAAFSYLYTIPILTNHTFEHVWLQDYPTYSTLTEGRWMSDLVIWAQGEAGVQSFQMILATLVQACNGLLLADLVGEKRRAQRFLLAALLCLYPAFIDFYSFSNYHLAFVLGDAFALLAALALVRGAPSRAGLVLAGLGFVLAIASYQPKLGLVALLLASVALLRLTRAAPEDPRPTPAGVIRDLGTLLLVGVGSGVIYWLTMRLTVSEANPLRTNVNTLAAAWHQVQVAYGETAHRFSRGIDGLSRLGHGTVLAILLVGVAGFAWDAGRRALWLVPVVLAVVAVIPVALRATYVVNDLAWARPGRILYPFGYCLLFFLARGLKTRLVGVAVAIAGAGLLWSFLAFDTQQVNYAAFKSQRDLWWIGRIADGSSRWPHQSPESRCPWWSWATTPRPRWGSSSAGRRGAIQLNTPAFEYYRQPTILNHFLGRKAFRFPTAAELVRARATMLGRRPWPAPESVYLADQTSSSSWRSRRRRPI